MRILFVLSAVTSLALCGPVIQENDSNVLKSVVGNFVNCVHSDLSLCLKEKALLVSERLSGIRELKIVDGFTIINNAPEKEGRSYEPLSSDLEERKRQVSERLSERAGRLIENTDLEVSVSAFDEAEEAEEARSVGEGRGKKKKEIKKKLKLLLPLLAILKIKALAIITLSIVVIAKSVFKLAVLAKLAFLYKLFVLIKELIHKHHHHDEGWAPHVEEHHEHHGHGWDGGWARTRNEANNLAYSAYNQ